MIAALRDGLVVVPFMVFVFLLPFVPEVWPGTRPVVDWLFWLTVAALVVASVIKGLRKKGAATRGA